MSEYNLQNLIYAFTSEKCPLKEYDLTSLIIFVKGYNKDALFSQLFVFWLRDQKERGIKTFRKSMVISKLMDLKYCIKIKQPYRFLISTLRAKYFIEYPSQKDDYNKDTDKLLFGRK